MVCAAEASTKANHVHNHNEDGHWQLKSSLMTMSDPHDTLECNARDEENDSPDNYFPCNGTPQDNDDTLSPTQTILIPCNTHDNRLSWLTSVYAMALPKRSSNTRWPCQYQR